MVKRGGTPHHKSSYIRHVIHLFSMSPIPVTVQTADKFLSCNSAYLFVTCALQFVILHIYHMKVRWCFSRSSTLRDPQLKGKDAAIRAACESDLVSYFWWKEGISFKNEFCALCNFPYNLKIWRMCEQPLTVDKDNLGTAYDMILLLSFTDTLPNTNKDNEERLACTSTYGVSQAWGDTLTLMEQTWT